MKTPGRNTMKRGAKFWKAVGAASMVALVSGGGSLVRAQPAPAPVDESLAPVTVMLGSGRSVKIVKCYAKGLMRASCFSFDDGRLEPDLPVIESLRKRHLPATFFLNSLHAQSADALANPGKYAGFEIASHSAHHIGMGKMPLEKAVEEITTDQKLLGERFHQKIEGFAYAYGDFPKDPAARDALDQAMTGLGILYARETAATNFFAPPVDFLRWRPDCGLGNDSLKSLEKFLKLPAEDSVRAMMSFAHSIDYVKGSLNRDLWEAYITRLAAEPTVWKTTLVEFARYVIALRKLQISPKGIFNPSAIPVWVKIDGRPVEILAGQTRSISL